MLTCLHLVVVTGKERPTQQEFNKLATSLGIANQPVVSYLHDIEPLQDPTLTLLLSPIVHLMPPRRTVLERGAGVSVTVQNEHCIGRRNGHGIYPILT